MRLSVIGYVGVGILALSSVAVLVLVSDADPRPCSDPAGMAIAASLANEPDAWKADRYYLTNERRSVKIWRNDIEMAWLGFSTEPCRAAMRRAAKPIVERDRRRSSEELAAQLRVRP